MFLNQITRFKILEHKLIKLKGEISKSTIVLMDFNTPLTVTELTGKPVRIKKMNTIK